jgi:hypothetical protein
VPSAPLHRGSVYLKRGNIHVTAGAVAAPRNQIDKPYFFGFAEVRRVSPIRSFAQRPVATHGNNPIDVKFHPPQAGKREFTFQKCGSRRQSRPSFRFGRFHAYEIEQRFPVAGLYYIMGGSARVLQSSPLLEIYRKKEIEVIILDDGMDVSGIDKYEDIDFKAVNKTSGGRPQG